MRRQQLRDTDQEPAVAGQAKISLSLVVNCDDRPERISGVHVCSSVVAYIEPMFYPIHYTNTVVHV